MDKKNETGARDVLEKIATYSEKYRDTALRLHGLLLQTAPQLQPRLWYGMPGYAVRKGGPVVLFFREDMYISFGITESANLAKLGRPEDGMVPSAWYLTVLDAEVEAVIKDIVYKVAD